MSPLVACFSVLMASTPASVRAALEPARSLREATADLSILAGVALIIGIGAPLVQLTTGTATTDAWTVLTSGGEEPYGQINWALPMTITVLLAFFGVTIGGQFLAGPMEANDLRRVLGYIAELMAAAIVPVFVFVTCYCIATGARWASLLVITPAVALIVFLGLQLGRFVVATEDAITTALEVAIERRRSRIDALERRSRRPLWRGLLVTTAIPAILLATITATISGGRSPIWLALALFAGIMAVLNGIGAWALHSYYTDLTRTRGVVMFLPGLINFLVGGTEVALIVDAKSPAGPILWGAAIVLGLLLVAVPRRVQPRWLLDWSVNGLIAANAARRLEAAQHAAETELANRPSSRAPQDSTQPAWRRRLLQFLIGQEP